MKSFLLRKKKLLISCVAVVLTIAVALTLLFSCGNKSGRVIPPSNSASIFLLPPKDGSKPQDHSGLENIGYLAGKLSERDFYHVENVSKVSAKSMGINVNQNVVGSKDFSDGILIVSTVSISESSLAPSKAQQRFYSDGKVVIRKPASSDKADWDGLNTVWSDDEPVVMDEESYIGKYGLWPTELTDYVINEETVIECSDVTVEDGVYSLKVSLNTESSVYYYVNQMKTMGDLKSNPLFESIDITFRFTEDWTILSYLIEEKYESYKGPVTANCTGTNEFTFYYEEDKVDVSAYDDYFSKYADADVGGDDSTELSASDYITQGFLPFLSQRTSLDLDLNIGEKTIAGKVAFRMTEGTLSELSAKIGSLTLEYKDDQIYFTYKDIIGKISVSDASRIFGDLLGGSLDGLDTSALLEQIMNAEITSKDGGKVILTCNLSLGGVEIPLEFGFTEEQQNGEVNILFDHVRASLSLGGVPVAAQIVYSEEALETDIDYSAAVDVAPFAEDIFAFITAGKYDIELSYANESAGLSIAGTLTADLRTGMAVQGEFTVNYAGLTIPVKFVYKDSLWLQIYNIKLSATEEELKTAIDTALEIAGFEMPDKIQLDIAEIINAVISLNFDEVFKELSLTENGLRLTINADLLLKAFGINDIAIGEISASYDTMSDAFFVSVAGLQVGVTVGSEEISVSEDEYIPLSKILPYVAPIKEILEKKDIAFTGGMTAEIEGIRAEIYLSGEVSFVEELKAGLNVTVKAGANELVLAVSYEQGKELAIKIGEIAVKFTENELEQGLSKLAQLLSKGDAESKAAGLILESGALQKFLESLTVIASADDTLSLWGDFSTLFGWLDVDSVNLSTDGSLITISADKILLGSFALSGTNLTVSAGMGEGFVEIKDAVSLWPFIESIESFIAAEKYEIELSYENASAGLNVTGTLAVDLSSTFAMQGAFTVNYADLQVPVTFTAIMSDGGLKVWVKVFELAICAEQADIDRLTDMLKNALVLQVPSLGDKNVSDIASVISALISADLSTIFSEISLTDNAFGLSADLSKLISVITGESYDLGMVNVQYLLDERKIAVSALGISASATVSEKSVSEPEGNYISAKTFLDLADSIISIINAKDIVFAAEFEFDIEGIVMDTSLVGEVKFSENEQSGIREFEQLYLSFTFARAGSATAHTVEILYDGAFSIAYGGYCMFVSEQEFSEIFEKISEMFEQSEVTTQQTEEISAILAFLSKNAAAIQKFAESLTISASEGNLSVLAQFENIILGLSLSELNISYDTGEVRLSADRVSLSGFSVRNLSVKVFVADNYCNYDFSKYVVCDNVFEFILNGYSSLFGSEYLGISLLVEKEDMSAEVGGKLHLAKTDDVGTVTFNLDLSAKITQGTDTHNIRIVILNDKVWLSYSVKETGGNPLKVTMPVSSLFEAGETILPILAPILGIEEDTYYYGFVNSILGGAYETINSDIFGVQSLSEWVDLLIGIFDEYDVIGGASKEQESETQTSPSSIIIDENAGIWSLSVEKEGLTLNLTTLPSDTALIAQPEGNYIDASSIANLMKDLLYAYNYKDFGYHIGGNITMSVLGIKLDLTVQIDAYIGVNEDGSVYMNLRLTTGGYYNALAIAIIGNGLLINGDTVTDITISDGKVYISRTQTTYYDNSSFWVWEHGFYNLSTPYRDYRAMSLSKFFEKDNLMSQLFFAINLSDKMQNYISEKVAETGTGETQSVYDVGDMVKSYSADENGYSFGLSLAAIANNTSLGDVQLNIGKTPSSNGNYDLTSFSGTMSLVSVITINIGDMKNNEPVTNHTVSDFKAHYGDMTPEEFAAGVKDGSIEPYRLAKPAVEANQNTVVSAFGCADLAALNARIEAEGILSLSNH